MSNKKVLLARVNFDALEDGETKRWTWEARLEFTMLRDDPCFRVDKFDCNPMAFDYRYASDEELHECGAILLKSYAPLHLLFAEKSFAEISSNITVTWHS